jgi:hypothetical protein
MSTSPTLALADCEYKAETVSDVARDTYWITRSSSGPLEPGRRSPDGCAKDEYLASSRAPGASLIQQNRSPLALAELVDDLATPGDINLHV